MKVKYRQLYSNDCGVCSIKNLLDLYKLDSTKVDVNISKEGTSLLDIKNELLNYFYKVDLVSFDILQVKKVKHFSPYICIIENFDFSHYVVIYKKDNKYLYVVDSLFKRTYKITYENFEKIDGQKAIIVSDIKGICSTKTLFKSNFLIPILSLIESIFLLYSTVVIQQIIDNGFKDAILYILIQIAILLITTIKVKSFLKTFKKIDKELIIKVNTGVFNLKDSYYKAYDINEIFYRTFDAYSLKSMYLNFIYNFIGEIILVILSYLLMIFYSYILALLIFPFLLLVIIISTFIFKKVRVATENKRTCEYEFIGQYKDSLSDEKYKSNHIKEVAIKSLQKYQEKDYVLERINIYQRVFFMFFQSILICLIILVYFTKLYDVLSIGSLIALINIVSLLLQPLLNICSGISFFSNYKLLKDRIKDIIDNIK